MNCTYQTQSTSQAALADRGADTYVNLVGLARAISQGRSASFTLWVEIAEVNHIHSKL